MQRLKRIQAAVWALVLFLNVLLPTPAGADAGTTAGIQLAMRSTETVVDSGKRFTYEIDYSVSSTTQQYSNALIALPLPNEIKFDSSIDSADTFSSYDSATHSVIFNFSGTLSAGTTGTLQVNAYFGNYTTPNDRTATTRSEFRSDQGSVQSNDVAVKARAAASWELSKDRSRPVEAVDPMAGSEVEYKLTFKDTGSGSYGKLSLSDVVVTDLLPDGAVLLGTRSTSGVTPAVYGQLVTWNLGTLGENSPSTVDFWVKVKYPSTITGTVTNKADASYTALGEAAVARHAEVTHGFTTIPQNDGTRFDKWVHQAQKEISPGQEVNFYIGGLYSRANVNLQKYEVVDMTPPHLELVQIETPAFSGIPSYKVQYTLNANPAESDWTDWDTVSASTKTTLKTADAPVSGANVKGVKLIFGEVPIDFDQQAPIELRYKSDPAFNAPVQPGTLVTNSAVLKYEFEGQTKTDTKSADVRIVQSRPLVEVKKSSVNGTNFSPGDTIKYRISISNSSYSSAALQNPVVTDLLPASLQYVAGSAKVADKGGLTIAAPTITAVPDTDPNRTLITWKWDDTLPATIGIDKKIELELEAVVKPGTSTGNIENVAEVSSDKHVYLNNADFTQKLFKNNKWYLYNSSFVYINSVARLVSVKWVQGDLDNGAWSKYPDIGKTTPGGNVKYKLQITNVGNIPTKGLLIVDALPRIGDTGVVDKSQRDSKWSPSLTGKITIPDPALAAKVKISYSTDPSVSMSDGHWSTEPPADLTLVTGVKFEFDDSYVIQPGQELELNWVMRAPIDAPPNQNAWASFGFTAKRADTNTMLLTTEPLKVGVVVNTSTLAEIGNYVWRDVDGDGTQNEGPEHGVNGVQVELYDEANLTTPLQTTITSNNQTGQPGYYLFPNLVPGNYKVRFITPDGYDGWTIASAGTGATGSDADPTTGWTAAIPLAAGAKNYDIDGGLIAPKGKIGDTVWLDDNGNGLQDAGEPGKSGVVVKLYDKNGFLIGTTTTDTNGQYLFPYLTAGDYTVLFEKPTGDFRFTKYKEGPDRTKDSDADVTTGKTATITLAKDEANMTIDAGLIEPRASLGDRVWIDFNENGVQDAGEPDLANVTVRLLDASDNVLATKTTDTNGNYLFDKLWAGTYKVQFVLPDGKHKFTVKGASTATPATDSDANTATGKTDSIELAHGESNMKIDAGVIQARSSIGNRVWIDDNANGVQDAGEPGKNGITVKLLNASGTAIANTTTVNDSIYGDGYYLFDKLWPGTYSVQFDLPAGGGYRFTQNGSDPASDTDSNANPATGRTEQVTLANNGDSNPTIDAGLVEPKASLGDRVWIDFNENGVQDAGEVGLAGVTVKLLDSSNNELATKTTDTNGNYLFDKLWPGTYKVKFILPNDKHKFTVKGASSATPATDSDAEPTNGITDAITLGHGQSRTDIDAGVIQARSSIGNRVWIDDNANGVQDTGEPGKNGVTVKLLNASGTVIATKTTVTDSIYGDGYYLFDNLWPDTYSVQFDLPAGGGYRFTQKGTDPASDTDSNADPATGRTEQVILANNGDSNPTIDAGLVEPKASLGDRVWIDFNENGVQDAGEVGLAGVTVKLLDSSNNELATKTTDTNGNYLFDKLWPGTYRVKFILPNDKHKFTVKGASTATPATDSDAEPTTGITDAITLGHAESNPNIDAGVIQARSSIGNRVWIDDNGDGVQDAGEPGKNGVTVKLLNASGTVIATKTTVTDSIYGDGYYLFDNLWPDTYSVQFDLPSGGGYRFTQKGTDPASDTDSNADPATGRTEQVTLTYNGQSIPTIDAGLVQPKASIGDRVWMDANDNGIQDAGELGKSGVTVKLLDSSGNELASKTTDTNGNFLFDQLWPGTYKVKFVLPDATFRFTKKGTAAGPGIAGDDSDADPDGITDPIVLEHAEANSNVDAGLIVGRSSIGNRVWIDDNGDGVQDAGEPGKNGVTVKLLNVSGNVIATTTTVTDSIYGDGYYQFANLFPDTYSVKFDLPSGYRFTKKGSDAASDSDSNADSTGLTAQVTLTANGDSNQTIDAGLVEPKSSLGDRVWIDVNENGVQDAGEPGKAGVTVKLLDSSNTVLATTTTDTNGNYLFDNLWSDTYKVQFVLPNNATFRFTTKGSAASPGTAGDDSDAKPDGTTDPIVLGHAESNMNVDAGLIEAKSSIGNRVWFDSNENGLQDPGETGKNGVTVKLLDASGNLLRTTATVTDATYGDGYYQFDNLFTGTYFVQFELPNTYLFTVKGINSASDLDSNADTSTGKTDAIQLGRGESNQTIDAGLVLAKGMIGDFVWIDTNKDGIQNNGEVGLNGVTVSLYNDSGALLTTTTTREIDGKAGSYLFTGLNAGTYKVKFTLPSGYAFSPLQAGSDRRLDSDATADGTTDWITLAQGESDLTIDAGLLPLPGALGDLVWFDANGDGIQNDGNTGLNGITVKLYNEFGQLLSSTVTSSVYQSVYSSVYGHYQFDNLNAGKYKIEFVLPDGYMFTTKGTGSNPAADSDVNPDGQTDLITLAQGETNLTIDAGLVLVPIPPAISSIGDYVWVDTNGDGVQNDGNTGMDGITVRLYSAAGNLLATTVTANVYGTPGYYRFNNLDAGQYRVAFDLPSGYTFTAKGVGDNRAADSDVNPNGWTDLITLAQGETNLTIDAGLKPIPVPPLLGAIGDYVWIDTNGDGIQNDGNTGLNGVTVKLYKANGDLLGSTVTSTVYGKPGYYLFDNLIAGQYQVEFSLPDGYTFTLKGAGSDKTIDSDAQADGKTSLITLAPGETNLTIDAGLKPNGTDNPGTGNPGTGNPGTGNPGTDNPGTGNPGTGNPGTGNPGTGNPGTGNPGTGNPGTGNPGTGNPGTGNPGTGNPSTSNPSTGNPSTGNPGTGNSESGNAETGSAESGQPDGNNPAAQSGQDQEDSLTDKYGNGLTQNDSDEKTRAAQLSREAGVAILPETGESLPIAPWVGALLIAAGVVLRFRKKRFNA
ncbi:SdrD B-like domain-containing protein [Paenibacillus hodogayensis]|uniref:SdrD B-like domain-containing protein n=1 Tax=Paenibacillus hodogayensis TaxID=279208 RepID=A0ABV5VR32_9BACL